MASTRIVAITRGRCVVRLPPGQRAVDRFPRFGTHLHQPAPAVPADPTIEIARAVPEPSSLPAALLATYPRREITADFHCVAGWSATNLHWEGVGFKTLYHEIIEPQLAADGPTAHVVFGGLDGYRAIVLLEDALGDDVLIADRLDGRPLDSGHGAPARLVSPSQSGHVSVKHLCRIELHTSQPPAKYHRFPVIQAGLRLLNPHPRARVWHEERHRYLPPPVLRPIYRLLIPPIATLSARGSRRTDR